MFYRPFMLAGAALSAFMIRSLGTPDMGVLALAPLPSSRSSRDKKDHTRVKGKSYPQHGERECARRVRQMQKAVL